MIINLSRASWHANYYKWVKGNYPTYQFKSLCPYFWTIVFLILCFPLILVLKTLGTIKRVIPIKKSTKRYSELDKEQTKFSKWWNKNQDLIVKWFGRIWIGVMCLFLILSLGFLVYDLFHKKGFYLGLIYILSIVGATTLFFLLTFGIFQFFDSDIWKMIRGMAYSVKNKVCPMIKWE